MLLIKRFLKSEKIFSIIILKKDFKKKTNFKYDFQNFIKQRTIKILIKHKKYT